MSRVVSLRRPKVVWETVDPRTGEVKPKVSRTKQADKDSCDINKILARYELTGQLPSMIAREPQYGDFTAVPDFVEACSIVEKAREQFGALAAEVRHRFNHDPAAMLAFCADPANAAEMVKLGLALPKPKVEEIAPAEAAPAASGAPV